MNFKLWITLFWVVAGTSLSAQQESNRITSPESRHQRFVGVRTTPISTTDILTVSVELGYSLGKRFQIMAGPLFFGANYERGSSAFNRPNVLHGGFVGTRIWWRGLPDTGWAYFGSGEVQLTRLNLDVLIGPPLTERYILRPEIGNGFGHFSQNGLYFIFQANFGTGIPIRTNIGGEVTGNLRLSAGLRF